MLNKLNLIRNQKLAGKMWQEWANFPCQPNRAHKLPKVCHSCFDLIFFTTLAVSTGNRCVIKTFPNWEDVEGTEEEADVSHLCLCVWFVPPSQGKLQGLAGDFHRLNRLPPNKPCGKWTVQWELRWGWRVHGGLVRVAGEGVCGPLSFALTLKILENVTEMIHCEVLQ